MMEDPPRPALTPGAQLGPYKIEALLGAGGMGEVFRATDTRLHRTVAIKVLARDKVADPARKSRFMQEARAASALNHPNIVTVYDIANESGLDYLVMEYVAGKPLNQLIPPEGLPLTDAIGYATQMAGALAAAHAAGIVHRDIKPANMMVTAEGQVKVLDFGLAKLEERAPGPDSETLTIGDTLTRPGTVMGTAVYMSPEQARAESLDARTDLFSFGAVLYEMSAGRRAFLKPLDWSTPPTDPLAPALRPLVLKLLETDRELRYQSATDIRTDLQRLSRDTEASRGTIGGQRGGKTGIARSWKVLVPAAAAVVATLVAGYFYFHRAAKLTDTDVLILADFTNTTGDPVFDGTLRQGLAIQIEQSPFLKIMDDAQVQDDLRLMNAPRGERITNPIAHEICVREGAAATIDGSIASLGTSYVITLEAIACNSGATLAREQTEAPDKEHVLNVLGTAATAVRAKLGESLSSIQKLNRPLEQATTPSLEALQNYTAGSAEMDQGHFLASVPLFERAIALDRNFAMAYYFLGVTFYNAGDMARAGENIEKAYPLIDRVSPYERASIAALYYNYYGQVDKAIDAYRLASRDYPRAWGFHNDLSELLIYMGQFEEGLKEGREAVQLEPRVEPPYRRLLDAYMCLDRLGEAKELAPKIRALGIDGVRIHQRFLEMAYLEGDPAAAATETQWFAGKAVEYISLGLQAAYRNVLGERGESSKLYQRAAETARRQELENVAAELEDADARADALSGNCRTAHRLGRPALTLALCGEGAQAEKLVAVTSKASTKETNWNAVQLPEIRAAIELTMDHPDKAVELLASASPYERGYPEVMYLRGLAYLRLKKGAEAAGEFQKILDHKGASWGATWVHPNWGQYYALSYVGLARAGALLGDKARAREAFEHFFALWKDADQNVPILIEAKKDYAALG